MPLLTNEQLKEIGERAQKAPWRRDVPALLDHIKAQESNDAALREIVREMARVLTEHKRKWGVRSGECNTCDHRSQYGHSPDCQIPQIDQLVSRPEVLEIVKETK